MVSLLSITPSIVTLKIGEESIPVPGISAAGIASLIERFPEVKALFGDQNVSFDAEYIMKLAPRLVSAILAAGLGHPGDEQAEKIAGSLPIGVQLQAIEKIIAVSAPEGLNPLVESVARLSGLLHTNSDDAGQNEDAHDTKVRGTN